MGTVPKIIFAFSMFCGILLYNISCNFKEFISGILASIVAAYIFFLLTDRLPSYMRRKERAQQKYVAYRNLQLFLTYLDGVFISIYCIRYGMGYGDLDSKAIENRMGLRDFYNVSMIAWLNDVILRPNSGNGRTSCQASDLKTHIEKEWKEARRYANRVLSSTYINRDAELEYLVSHLIFDHSVNVLFRMMETNPKETYRASCLISSVCGKAGDREKAVQDIISIHEHAIEMYRDLANVKDVSSFLYPPPFYREESLSNDFCRKIQNVIGAIRRSITVVGVLLSMAMAFLFREGPNFSACMFFCISAVVLAFKQFCEYRR